MNKYSYVVITALVSTLSFSLLASQKLTGITANKNAVNTGGVVLPPPMTPKTPNPKQPLPTTPEDQLSAGHGRARSTAMSNQGISHGAAATDARKSTVTARSTADVAKMVKTDVHVQRATLVAPSGRPAMVDASTQTELLGTHIDQYTVALKSAQEKARKAKKSAALADERTAAADARAEALVIRLKDSYLASEKLSTNACEAHATTIERLTRRLQTAQDTIANGSNDAKIKKAVAQRMKTLRAGLDLQKWVADEDLKTEIRRLQAAAQAREIQHQKDLATRDAEHQRDILAQREGFKIAQAKLVDIIGEQTPGKDSIMLESRPVRPVPAERIVGLGSDTPAASPKIAPQTDAQKSAPSASDARRNSPPKDSSPRTEAAMASVTLPAACIVAAAATAATAGTTSTSNGPAKRNPARMGSIITTGAGAGATPASPTAAATAGTAVPPLPLNRAVSAHIAQLQNTVGATMPQSFAPPRAAAQ